MSASCASLGLELKEASRSSWHGIGINQPDENLTFEGFYQYDWEKIEIDPPGIYWSTNDFAGEGGNKVLLGFGDLSDLGTSFAAVRRNGSVTDVGSWSPPKIPSDDGQFGLAVRVYAPRLNDTEFGFYYHQLS